MPDPGPDWLSILTLAEGEPIGLLLSVSDFDRARAGLYQARTKVPGRFGDLQFRASPFPDGNLVICRAGVQAPAQTITPTRRGAIARAAEELDL